MKVKGVLCFSVNADLNSVQSMDSDSKKKDSYTRLRSAQGIEGMDIILPEYNNKEVRNLFKANSGDIIVVLNDDIEENLLSIVCIWHSNAKLDELINICIKKIDKEISNKKIEIDSTIPLQFFQAYSEKNKIETLNPIEYLCIEKKEKKFKGRPVVTLVAFMVGIIAGLMWYLSKNDKLQEICINIAVATGTYVVQFIVEGIIFFIERKNRSYGISMAMLPDYSEAKATFGTPNEE